MSLCTSARSLVPSSLHPLIRLLQAAINSHLQVPFPRLCEPSSLSFLSILYMSLQPPSCLPSLFQYLSCPGKTRAGPLLLMHSHKSQEEGNYQVPQSAASASPKTAWDAVGCLCCQGTLLAHDQFVHRDLQFFPLQIGFLASWPPACTVAWGYSISEAGLCILVCWIVIMEFNVLSYNFVLVRINGSEFVIWE